MSEKAHTFRPPQNRPHLLVFAAAGLVWAFLLLAVLAAASRGGNLMERLARHEPDARRQSAQHSLAETRQLLNQ
jgi:hypothetical protein